VSDLDGFGTKSIPAARLCAAGTKASPAVTDNGPKQPLRHEESDSCGSGERMPWREIPPAERLSVSADAACKRRAGKKPPLLRERAGKWLTGPG